mmetsp:Transcript_12910/g.22939  ORF Transcript_12910/g.22939 Transcript_12910/m.22939 type:complete len:227 (+) Transcript_12910:444-1124(+)
MGPLLQCICDTLTERGVGLTQYFGGQFLGRHLAMLSNGKDYDFFFKDLANVIQELGGGENPRITPEQVGEEVQAFNNIRGVWELFFKFYVAAKSSAPIDDTRYRELKQMKDDFFAAYRDVLRKETVIPKMHMLEAHLLQFAQIAGTLWAYCEEGLESSHRFQKTVRERSDRGQCGMKRKHKAMHAQMAVKQDRELVKKQQKMDDAGRQRKKHTKGKTHKNPARRRI